MNYNLTKPCANCPFRNDIQPYLRPERVEEIEHSLVRSEFPCHKTIKYTDQHWHGRETPKTEHCAGALILLEKIEQPSQMMRIAERIGLYDRRRLDMGAPVFDDFEEMRFAQGDDL